MLPAKLWLFSTLCDNQCLSFARVLLGTAFKTIFLENYLYSSSPHTETRRADNPASPAPAIATRIVSYLLSNVLSLSHLLLYFTFCYIFFSFLAVSYQLFGQHPTPHTPHPTPHTPHPTPHTQPP
jgi:hypothetical protein